MKYYQYKIYDKSNTLKKTLSNKSIMSDLSFSENINWWQWEISIDLDFPFSNNDFIQGDLVKIREFSNLNPNGRQIYFGRISKIVRTQNVNSEFITLICLWISTLLNEILFDNAGKTFTLNQDPADTIKDIIDYANTKYNIFTYWTNIETYWTNINIWFDYDDCFEAIKKTVETTDFRWYIDPLWEVYFKAKPITPTHRLTNTLDVEYIDRSENSEDVVNKIYVKYDWWEVTSEDVTSQTTYWLRELREERTDLKNSSSAQEYADKYISKNKDPKPESKVVVNSKYDIATIKPWDTISILNFDFWINNVQVLKTDYDWDKCNLTLERLYTFGDAVLWNK
jgi:hypothetical protein